MILPGASSKPAAASDPLALIGRLPSTTTDEEGARLVCQKVLLRELGREPVYRRLLECVLGFAQQPAQTTDGGWLQRPRRGGAGKDARVPLLSSDPRFAWNALHILRSLRDTREIQLDETMLPYRTQDWLNGDPLFEEVATANSRRLWEQIYYARTLPRVAPAPVTAGGGGSSTGAAAVQQAQQLPPGGGAVATGGDGSSTGLTRLPLLLPLLDHFFFCFAYWAVTHKRSASDYGTMSMHQRKELYDHELRAAQGSLTPRDIVGRQHGGVYFELLQAYIQGFFPRETGGPDARGGPPLEVLLERALRMTPEAEKFLRVLVEMWLERNTVVNPDRKPGKPEPSVAENELTHPSSRYYHGPTTDALHGLLLLVGHLVARKVDIDVRLAQQQQEQQTQGARGGGGAAARLLQYGPPACPALDALQQPLFIYLSLAFRHLRVAPQGWTQFFLAVELWLAWIDPDCTWRRVFGGEQPPPQASQRGASPPAGQPSQPNQQQRGAAGARWREQHLRAHVAGNYNFYTTLLVLYMRKAREALGSDASRQFQVLSQARRVMRVFRDTALHGALTQASAHVGQLWRRTGGNLALLLLQQQQGGGGGGPLLHHLRALRLLNSRPCLWEDACQDAHHLAAELLAAKRRAEKEWEGQQRSWMGLGTALGWLSATLGGIFLDEGGEYGAEPPSGGQVRLPELIAVMDQVLGEVFGIFPSVEAKCLRPLRDADVAGSRDAERQGLLLTAKGREQLLLGKRGCDPTKARFLGDPLFDPEPREHELACLVPWAQRASVRLSLYFYPDWEPSAAARRVLAKEGEQEQEPPRPQPEQQPGQQQPPQHEGGHIDVRRRSAGAVTPIDLRWLADRRNFFALALLLGVVGMLVLVQRMLQGLQRALTVGE